jgi:hypothetical protein
LLVHGTRYSNRLKIYNEHMARIQQLNQKEQQQQQQLNAQAGEIDASAQKTALCPHGQQCPGQPVEIQQPLNLTKALFFPFNVVVRSFSSGIAYISSSYESCSTNLKSWTPHGWLSHEMCCTSNHLLGCQITGPFASYWLGFASICDNENKSKYGVDAQNLITLIVHAIVLCILPARFVTLLRQQYGPQGQGLMSEILDWVVLFFRFIFGSNFVFICYQIYQAQERRNVALEWSDKFMNNAIDYVAPTLPFASAVQGVWQLYKAKQNQAKEMEKKVMLQFVQVACQVMELQWVIPWVSGSVPAKIDPAQTGDHLGSGDSAQAASAQTGGARARGRSPGRKAAGITCSKCQTNLGRHGPGPMCCACWYQDDRTKKGRGPAIHKGMCVTCANTEDPDHKGKGCTGCQ